MVEHGAMSGSSRAGKIAAAARRDYAEAIAAVMLDPAKQGKIHELAGDDAFTLQGMAEAVSACATAADAMERAIKDAPSLEFIPTAFWSDSFGIPKPREV